MALNVRISSEIERQLEKAAREEGITKSDIIRQCVEDYLEKRRQSHNPWVLGKDLFGKYGSGKKRRSSSTKTPAQLEKK